MKTLTLRETPTFYTLEVDRTAVVQEPALLQANGQPVAILMPVSEYAEYQQWRKNRSARSKRNRVVTSEEIENAITAYQHSEITLGRAAEKSGMTRWELMKLLEQRGTPVTIEVPSVAKMDQSINVLLELQSHGRV
ncbi:UPF0175 family protein [Candidatus Amarolinea dominans]|uniref:UPF0175 family protein n=1 Tax=Candidatus Amarolinea dominans TaxID=3140696 RepID=UPI0031364676|nr:UPF0175 family protein [Anaerolineae bacterium]